MRALIKSFSIVRAAPANAAIFSTRRPLFWLAVVVVSFALGFTSVTLYGFFQVISQQQATANDAPQKVDIHYVYATRPLPVKTAVLPFNSASAVEELPQKAKAMPDFALQIAEDAEQSAYRQRLYESIAKALKERSAQ
ncbi:hypothetical protein ABU178_00175 [Pantoea osteomyelitidis]|uniref:Uncharacterized protein n=1 Tax=Pantoea osteomyelitidis TaxID=3230026 RepID=A0ABW7PS16_9GAMM